MPSITQPPAQALASPWLEAALQTLAGAGAHLVLCGHPERSAKWPEGQPKRAVGTAWQKTPRSASDCVRWLRGEAVDGLRGLPAAQRHIGIMPWSIGAALIDSDGETPEANAAAVKAIEAHMGKSGYWLTAKSLSYETKGRLHLWFAVTEGYPNAKVRFGPVECDTRSAAGYVACSPDYLIQLAEGLSAKPAETCERFADLIAEAREAERKAKAEAKAAKRKANQTASMGPALLPLLDIQDAELAAWNRDQLSQKTMPAAGHGHGKFAFAMGCWVRRRAHWNPRAKGDVESWLRASGLVDHHWPDFERGCEYADAAPIDPPRSLVKPERLQAAKAKARERLPEPEPPAPPDTERTDLGQFAKPIGRSPSEPARLWVATHAPGKRFGVWPADREWPKSIRWLADPQGGGGRLIATLARLPDWRANWPEPPEGVDVLEIRLDGEGRETGTLPNRGYAGAAGCMIAGPDSCGPLHVVRTIHDGLAVAAWLPGERDPGGDWPPRAFRQPAPTSGTARAFVLPSAQAFDSVLLAQDLAKAKGETVLCGERSPALAKLAQRVRRIDGGEVSWRPCADPPPTATDPYTGEVTRLPYEPADWAADCAYELAERADVQWESGQG